MRRRPCPSTASSLRGPVQTQLSAPAIFDVNFHEAPDCSCHRRLRHSSAIVKDCSRFPACRRQLQSDIAVSELASGLHHRLQFCANLAHAFVGKKLTKQPEALLEAAD